MSARPCPRRYPRRGQVPPILEWEHRGAVVGLGPDGSGTKTGQNPWERELAVYCSCLFGPASGRQRALDPPRSRPTGDGYGARVGRSNRAVGVSPILDQPQPLPMRYG